LRILFPMPSHVANYTTKRRPRNRRSINFLHTEPTRHWRPASALILGKGLTAHKLFWGRTWGAMASCRCWLLEKPLEICRSRFPFVSDFACSSQIAQFPRSRLHPPERFFVPNSLYSSRLRIDKKILRKSNKIFLEFGHPL
jgi:hypothetical protein